MPSVCHSTGAQFANAMSDIAAHSHSSADLTTLTQQDRLVWLIQHVNKPQSKHAVEQVETLVT